MDDHDHHAHHHHGHDDMEASTPNITAQITTMLVEAVTSTLAPAVHQMVNNHDHSMDHAGHNLEDIAHMDSDHGVHDNHMDMNGSGHMMMDHMKMYFHIGVNEKILFYEWETQTTGAMVGAVIGVVLLALLYEGLKFVREHLYRHQYSSLTYSTCAVTGNNVQGSAELHKITSNRLLSWPHLVQTALHVIQVLLSYFLMLIFMTFNIWLCLGILIGSGMGFFLFGWRKATIVDISDHCH